MIKIFLIIFAISACVSQPNFFYIKNITLYVKPLTYTGYNPYNKGAFDAFKREIPIQGHKIPSLDQVKIIQKNCNAYKYEINLTKFPTASEFKSEGKGDCKGFAICKYYKLRSEGFKDSELNFWSGRYNGEPHLILVVHVENKDIVMDIGKEDNLPEAKNYFYKNFFPTDRFNSSGWDMN